MFIFDFPSVVKNAPNPPHSAPAGVSATIPAPPPPPPPIHNKPLTLVNKASALALFALVFTFIPAHHASAQANLVPTFGDQTFPNLVFTHNKPITPVTLPAATGGDPPLIYSFFVPPPGLTVDGNTRILSGTPTFSGQTLDPLYQVMDSDGDNPLGPTFTIRTEPDTTPTFNTATIPAQTYAATVDVGTITLPTATGGNRALTYTISPALPDGLTFDGNANPPTITGIPAAAVASADYTYTATDDDGSTATLTFALEITAAPLIFDATIPRQRYAPDEPISVALPAATGGDGTLTYAITEALPDGLIFTPATRVLAGTPTTEQDAVEYTYTVTDSATTPNTAQQTFTIAIGQFGTERVVEKTLAAFGRAFATGTVGVFEDYLSTPAGRANTSHFTIGGHKFELAAVGTGRDLSAPAHLNEGGDPVQTLPAQPDCRAQGCARTTMSARDLLMKSAFHFNLNDDASGNANWSLWARATTSNFDGKPENDFDLNGDVTSAYLGADYRTPTGVRLGLAISESDGEIDYDDQADDIQGDLDADLTSILPYIQWQPNDTTNAWVVLGYGEGEAELATDGDAETTEVDIEMQMIAAGISGDLTTWKRSEWSWKASAFAVELESDKNTETDLPAVTADSQRLRLAMQGRIPGTPSPNGAQLTPNWELGLRWDDGDAEQGGGADLGMGFDYRHPASGLSMQGKANALLVHEENDYEEWNASLQVRFDPGARGRGVTFTLEPGWSKNGRSQQMGMDFSNALGKWTKRGLRLELTGERTEKTDDNIGHNIRLTGSLRF